MDSTGGGITEEGVVGHPELAAVGPEAHRHYSWAFHFVAYGPDRNDMWSSCKVVNLPDVAVLTRHDHVVVKSACADMVERNPGMVR